MQDDELITKLKKIISTKAKYKYKEKIDFSRSLFMRFLGYNSKLISLQIKENSVQNEQEYDDLEDEFDKEEEKNQSFPLKKKDLISTDIISNWKKCRGYPSNQKIYIIMGQYQDLRNYLNQQGWIENENCESVIFDLKWVTKKKDIDRDQLLDQQITNHYEKNFNLTSKNGIAKNLRNLIWFENIDIDKFYPRCYDLEDVQDFEDFVEEFKFAQAESVLKQFLIEDQQSLECKYRVLYFQTAILAIYKKTRNIIQKIQNINDFHCFVITPNEWKMLNCQQNFHFLHTNESQYNHLKSYIYKYLPVVDQEIQNLPEIAKKYLSILKEYDVQYELNIKNIWIIKPAGLSRGRGIRTFQQLDPLLNYIVGKDVNWVAQKYMENPLTINRKKFDIRQWIIVSEWNPLTIYFYDECYVRICFEEYNTNNLQNKFVHLANNCISKHAENFSEKINETMMFLSEFIDYLKERENGRDIYHEIIKKQIQQIAINSIKSCKDAIINRKNSFELYGYDFMVDEDYKVWLLEVNSSPSMEYSTNVTTKIVKSGLEDIGKLIQQHFIEGEKKFKKDQEFGLWKNIYRENK